MNNDYVYSTETASNPASFTASIIAFSSIGPLTSITAHFLSKSTVACTPSNPFKIFSTVAFTMSAAHAIDIHNFVITCFSPSSFF